MSIGMNNKPFSEWLRKILQEKGWTEADLARKSGIIRQTINNYTNGRINKPDEDVLQAIAHALRLPPEEVFREAGLLPPKKPLAVREEAINYKISLLPEPEQEQVLEFVDFLLERSERNERVDKPKEVGSTQ